MARTKEFDPDTVLRRALELFWERGYDATSMSDLVAHLGIAKASIYGTYGGKRELFLKALQRYLETTDPVIMAELSQPGPVLPAVRGLVERFVTEASSPDSYLGCMVVHSAVEMAHRDEAVARLVESSWSHLETTLTSALLRARAQGELSADSDPRAIARFLLVFFQGVRVLERAPDSAVRLRDAARTAVSILR
ncbi:TetR/AcrR family transcriptional regulator [Nocardia seriolae]|uniref:TetR family transcriptional regulator n=1 Tax=Nocardia seriolae TaxID=37332 RepID=A0ABC9Z5M7_9NOCA|nr:TetR/AcrR family transcriptional regulator [Nocardia seriolae]BEK99187.1 TetR/AcrR family transcriptional regulator [Nocardia seriolae]GAM50860.1 TetR family transcriptional regulator [Nocardia seriolae]GAP32820.1 TetR family transcriptional regulator [Nocardia seriolae]